MSKIVNVKTDDYDIYIGRPSKWGNPFKVGADGTRKECIEKYRKWLQEPEQKHLLESLDTLENKVLGCHCKPQACHGDVLIDLVSKRKARKVIEHLFFN